MLPLVIPDALQSIRRLEIRTALFIEETEQWTFDQLVVEVRIDITRPELIDWDYLTAQATIKAREVDPSWRWYTNWIVEGEEVLKWAVV